MTDRHHCTAFYYSAPLTIIVREGMETDPNPDPDKPLECLGDLHDSSICHHQARRRNSCYLICQYFNWLVIDA
jgi:hypothetical protein